MFWAFSEKQFNIGLKKLNADKTEICSIGSCGFLRKSDLIKWNNIFSEHEKEHEEAMKNKKYVYDMFRYELSNHEYIITYDVEDTLDALGLTWEEVENSDLLKTQFKKAKSDYLKEMEFLE